jgi:hypothetical protein
MKKELLMASALVSTVGAASIAEAVTASYSGSLKIGQEFESPDTGADTNNNKNTSNFSISLSETTDGGTTISSSFMLTNEGGGAPDDDNAITLTFSDGSKIDLLNAGNASSSHAVAVPGASGEQGIAGTTTNGAPTGLDFTAGATALGVEIHSGADFLAEGLKMSASFSGDDGAAATGTAAMESSWGVGATYVTSAGDTAVTIGAGLAASEYKNNQGNALVSDPAGFHVGLSAVTGSLTIGVGYGDGDGVHDEGNGVTAADNTASAQVDGNVFRAGISYVTGDLTLALGTVNGEAKDSTTMGTAGTSDDAHDEVNASVTYAVASGVSAIIGYTTVDQQDEGVADQSGGSAWYVGATMSF